MSAYADLLWVYHSKVYEGRSLAATQNGDASGERLRASNPSGPRPFGAEGFGAWPPRCLSTHCPNSGWSLPASVDESRPPPAFGLGAGWCPAQCAREIWFPVSAQWRASWQVTRLVMCSLTVIFAQWPGFFVASCPSPTHSILTFYCH